MASRQGGVGSAGSRSRAGMCSQMKALCAQRCQNSVVLGGGTWVGASSGLSGMLWAVTAFTVNKQVVSQVKLSGRIVMVRMGGTPVGCGWRKGIT